MEFKCPRCWPSYCERLVFGRLGVRVELARPLPTHATDPRARTISIDLDPLSLLRRLATAVQLENRVQVVSVPVCCRWVYAELTLVLVQETAAEKVIGLAAVGAFLETSRPPPDKQSAERVRACANP